MDSLRKQIEFYFSDANLLKDKFMRHLIEGEGHDKLAEAGGEGWVKLELLGNFKKLQSMCQTLQVKAEELGGILTAAAEESSLEVSDDGLFCRRKTPWIATPDALEKANRRTIFVDNLPLDIDHESLAQLCSRFGEVRHVSLPRYKQSREFKGNGFVQFESENSVIQAKVGLNQRWPKEFEVAPRRRNKKGLVCLSHAEWEEWKKESREANESFASLGDNRAAPTSRTPKPLANKRSRPEGEGEPPKLEIFLDVGGASMVLPQGARGHLVQIDGLEPPLSSLAIRQFVEHTSVPDFVDFTPMETKAWIRFSCEEDANAFVEDCNLGRRCLGTCVPSVSLLSQDDESAYWQAAVRRKKRKLNEA